MQMCINYENVKTKTINYTNKFSWKSSVMITSKQHFLNTSFYVRMKYVEAQIMLNVKVCQTNIKYKRYFYPTLF